jgi:hypothetical protein
MLAKLPFDYVVFTKIDEVTINVFLAIIRSKKIDFFPYFLLNFIFEIFECRQGV